MWPDSFIGMQQHLLETAAYTHTLVPGEILQKCRETFLQADGDVDSLNCQGWTGVEQVMSEHEVIPIQVAHSIVAEAVWSVVDCLRDFDTIGAVEFVQLVGVADTKIDRACLRTGIGGAFPQENLNFAKIHAGEGRRFAPREPFLEAQLLDIEFDAGWNVPDPPAAPHLLPP